MPPICGVYTITNAVNGLFYIGSSQHVTRRWKEHTAKLLAGKARSPKLQNAWNKYGRAAFVFAVAEECSPGTRLEREQAWLDDTRCYERGKGYNCAKDARAPMTGRKHSEETREKLSAVHKGKPKTQAQKDKQRISMTGRRASPETKERQRQAQVGRAHSAETLQKMRSAHKGRKHTAETRARISSAKKGQGAGRVCSEEVRAKLSAWQKGRRKKPLTAEHRANLSRAGTGRKLTDEAKATISRKAIERHAARKALI